MIARVGMQLVRERGKTSGAIRFALIFLLHFLYQDKKWNRLFHQGS